MKRRIASLLLALLLLFSLTACSSESAYQLADAALDAALEAVSEEEESLPEEITEVEETEEAAEAEESGGTEDPLPAESVSDPSSSEEAETAQSAPEETQDDGEEKLPEDGCYTTRDDVALYIHQYGHLPGNFITKQEAKALGWSGGSLESYAPGKCIGGSTFGNYEGLLPQAEGRTYTECDIDTLGASSRGAKRIVFSNDGLIYYTEDHYESFTLLYGQEDAS